MKKTLALSLAIFSLFALSGCQQTSKQSSASSTVSTNVTKTKDGKPIDIAWIGKTLNNPWWVSVADFATVEGKSLGVTVNIALPQEEVDLEAQVAMVDAAIQRKSNVIVISAASSSGIIPEIKKARAAGIKIVNFDTRISDPKMYDAYVGADDVAGSYKAGKYICERLKGHGDIGIITGILAQSTGVDRRAGFMKAVAEYPGIKIVAEAPGNWDSATASNATSNMLSAHPQIKAIFACNDQMAQGMVSAVKTSGKKKGDLILVGYDGILDSTNMVMDGDLDADVALPNIDEGEMGIKIATALVVNPDYKFSREILYPTPLVTKEYVKGLTDETVYEYASEHFPLRGISKKGY